MNPGVTAPQAPANNDPSQFGNYSDWAQSQMAKGFTADQLHQSLQAGGASVQPQKESGGGNWLTHLLPTGGAIGGGVGGAALGASLGSVVPILGTGIGGILGGIIGAASGSGGAKVAENALENKNINDGVGAATIEGGVGQAAGGIFGKVLGKGAEFLGNRAGSISKAATDAKTVADAGTTNLANSQTMRAIYGTSKNDIGAAQTIADKAGIDMTNPAALKDAGHQMVTNGGQVLDDIVGQTKIPIAGAVDASGNKVAPGIDDLIHSALTNTNPLTAEKLGASRSLVLGGLGPNQTDEDLLRNGYTRFLSSSAKSGANTPATNYLQEANQLLSGVNHGSTASANDLLQAQRLVGDKAFTMSQAAAKPSANEVTQAQADTWKDLNRSLQNMIFEHPDVSAAAKAMQGTHGAEAFGGNQQLADLFNSRVTGAQSGKDINALMHDAYNVRGAGTDGLNVINNPASSGTLALDKQTVAANKATAAPGALNGTDAANHMMNNAGGGITGMAAKLAAHSISNPTILNLASRIGGMGAKLAPAATITAATAAGMGADPVGNPSGGATIGGIMNDQQQQPGMTANGTTDPNSMHSILQRLMQMGSVNPQLMSSLAPVIGALAPQVQKQSLLGSEMSALPSSYANAGGAQGIGGVLSHVSSLIPGTAANTFENQSAGVAQQLANQLGISPEAAAGLLPRLMQNQQSAGLTQGVLGNMQSQFAN
jgi:hypothetical protein